MENKYNLIGCFGINNAEQAKNFVELYKDEKTAFKMVEKSFNESICVLIGGYCGNCGCSEHHCYFRFDNFNLLR